MEQFNKLFPSLSFIKKMQIPTQHTIHICTHNLNLKLNPSNSIPTLQLPQLQACSIASPKTMGNHTSHHPSSSSSASTGKVILPDGEVQEFIQPLTVAELMLDHPQQVVAEFESIGSGTRPVPLPADKKLEMKKVYIMLPMKRGRVVPLSADEARRILLRVKPMWRPRPDSALPSLRILPLFAQMCTHVGLVGNDHQIVLNREDNDGDHLTKNNNKEVVMSEVFCESAEAFSRQFSGRGWKPSLDTIKEKGVQKRVSHWLF